MEGFYGFALSGSRSGRLKRSACPSSRPLSRKGASQSRCRPAASWSTRPRRRDAPGCTQSLASPPDYSVPPMPAEPDSRFPGESGEYRRARNQLLESEIELRRTIERVAAQRRTLPAGGPVPQDYRFEEVADGGGGSFSELFQSGKDTLAIYNFMFPPRA